MKDYIGMAIEIIKECDAVGIVPGNIVEVKLNSRAKSRWGLCRGKLNPMSGKTEYTIEIGEWMADDKYPDELIRNTIAHEVLHSCDGCMNHGAKWHRYAEIMNSRYGYKIQTYVSKEEQLVRNEIEVVEYKYKFRCDKCGHEFGKHRMCGLVRNPSNYHHSVCGGRIIRIK